MRKKGTANCKNARETAEHLETDHHEYIITPEEYPRVPAQTGLAFR
ncbi:MAG: asparagine synthase-related protein [Dethiobacteria bacterium]